MLASDRDYSLVRIRINLRPSLNIRHTLCYLAHEVTALADVLIHNFLASTLIVTHANSNAAAPKQELAWSTNSRESTVEEKPNGNVDDCKSLALTDYPRSNQTPSYWGMEATHLKEEFWIIQGSRSPNAELRVRSRMNQSPQNCVGRNLGSYPHGPFLEIGV